MASTGKWSDFQAHVHHVLDAFSYPSLLALGMLVLAFIVGTFIFSLNTPYVGARVSRADNRWSVTQVDLGGLAREAGIKAGDGVIAMNGLPAQQFDRVPSPVSIRDLVTAGPTGATTSVSVENGHVSRSTILESVIFLFISMTFWLIGFVLCLLRSTTRHVRLLYFLYLLIAILLAAELGVSRNVFWIQHLERISWFLAPSVFLHFCLVFPVKKQAALLGRWLLPLVYLPAAVIMLAYVAWGRYEATWYPTFRSLMVLNMMLGLLSGSSALVYTFFSNRYVRFRQQIKIIMLGVIAAVSPTIALVILPDILFEKTVAPPQLSSLTLSLMPAALAYAVVKHKLFDVDLLMRRAALSVVLLLPLVLVYAIMLLTLNYFLKNSGLVERNVALLLFTIAAFLLLLWARSVITRAASRMLYTSSYDYKRSVREISAALHSITDAGLLAGFTVKSISNTLGLSGAQLVLPENNGELSHKASSGVYAEDADLRLRVMRQCLEAGEEAWFPNLPPAGSPVAFLVPLKAKDKQPGILCLGPKRSSADFSADDISFIFTVAEQVAVVLDNIKLTDEKEGLQKQLLQLQIRRERSRFRLVVDAVSEGICVTDPDMSITMWNPAAERMTGRPASSVIGTHCSEFLDYRDEKGDRLCHSPDCPLKSAMAGDESWKGRRVTLETANSRKLFLSISTAPLKDERGRITAGVMVLRDVSNEVEVEKMKSYLLSTISHELRTPLATIKGYSSMLIDYEAMIQSEEKMRHVRSIDNAADRLTELVDRLLDMSRIEAGLFRLAKHDIAIKNLIVETVADAKQRSPEHRLMTDLPEELPVISLDEKRIRQVLDNLLENAIRYSNPGTEIMIKARTTDMALQVSIADQGAGIHASEIDKVFDPMYRLENRLAQDPRGMGLGLPLCKELVKAHQGRIWLESEVGKGTIAYFTLPLTRQDEGSSIDKTTPLFWWQSKKQ